MDTKLLARKMLESGDLDKPGYTLKQLFEIRDALCMLHKYNLADLDLLQETEKYIRQLAGRG